MTKEMITARFSEAGIEITEKQAQQLLTLTHRMLEHNKITNLTRITEDDEIIEKHYIDSILPLTMTDVPRGTLFADVGTGAGFPAIPMMIYRPDLKFTLIDSLKKRTDYLSELVLSLSPDNIPEILHIRSEEAGRNKKYREKFDFVTARAVAGLNVLCEYCIPFLKPGGYFLAMKGEKDETDLAGNALRELKAEITDIKNYTLPAGDKRCLIVIRKTDNTPERYPRISAKIQKNPL